MEPDRPPRRLASDSSDVLAFDRWTRAPRDSDGRSPTHVDVRRTDDESPAQAATADHSGYPTDRLFEEVAFVAYYFNWSHEEVLALPHWERNRWCEEISAINERRNDDESSDGRGSGSIDLGELS